uniref:Putative ovule protein n=1 Tax=Solanum chacoense TaxID=4108 RepID=A0A0V0GKE0_SOLCH
MNPPDSAVEKENQKHLLRLMKLLTLTIKHNLKTCYTLYTPQVMLLFNYARGGCVGNQNVNKVNTKVDMSFNVENAYWLHDRVSEKA